MDVIIQKGIHFPEPCMAKPYKAIRTGLFYSIINLMPVSGAAAEPPAICRF
jgi:hypothetical protein